MSTQSYDTDRPRSQWFRVVGIALFALITAVPLIPTAAGAQAYGGAGYGGAGYGGAGYGGAGYGGAGYGRMGGSGMMGGWGTQAEQQLTLAQSMRFLEQSAASARVDKARNQVIFSGRRVFIAMAAVQPGFADTTFEVAGLVDPTIEVPAGASITLMLVNMDYGPDMDHGVVITGVAPPYPVLSMMGMQGALTGVPVLPPRDLNDAKAARYAAESVTFNAPESGGDYYYLCQYRDHASKGMFGRFEVR